MQIGLLQELTGDVLNAHDADAVDRASRHQFLLIDDLARIAQRVLTLETFSEVTWTCA